MMCGWRKFIPQATCGNNDPSTQDNLGPELQGGLAQDGLRLETVQQGTHSKVPPIKSWVSAWLVCSCLISLI